ncbi:MAG: cysteine desulfurase [Patescibacteria group bacterium]|nr:cysteine desulfurase [Patescibacteria group bacterium]
MRKIYLDYAATTPIAPEVLRAMTPYFSNMFGNSGSLHGFGQEAVSAIDNAREVVARIISTDFEGVVYTSSATEANNLVLRGVVKALRTTNHESHEIRNSKFVIRPRIIISSLEHESIQKTAYDLEREGCEVIEIPVNCEGVIDITKLKQALNERTILVSVMYANNEIGTVQPIAEIAEVIRSFREERNKNHEKRKNFLFSTPYSLFPLFHTDAVQAFQFLECDMKKLEVDMITLSAHKIYGPKGVGVLCIRKKPHEVGIRNQESGITSNSPFLIPVMTGGGQEFGLRSGTENVSGIVGFAEAVRRVTTMRMRETRRIAKLREKLWCDIKKICPKVKINGIDEFKIQNSKFRTLPNILNVYFPGMYAEEMLVRFGTMGVAVSAGPACSSRATEPSRIIRALGYSATRARQSIRFSFGAYTTEDEIVRAGNAVRKIVRQM